MKITIKNLQKKIPVYPKRIKKSILEVLAKEAKRKSGEITVCFVNDTCIKKLNLKYHRRNQATDVLAFDDTQKNDSSLMLADIAVSVDTARRNAKKFNTLLADELRLYAIHGLLHLLGFADRTKKQRELMRKKERKYANT
ncbi:MAG: rRNA maturation RNase YbeY [Candidatus Omnitrophica bacterium]|nr:rRNA maturation RNase YbeY [Candidatus Omnitrophota bacterium]